MNLVLCDGGLCNRLNALLFALVLHRRFGTRFGICWPVNNWCGAPFESLFECELPHETTGILDLKARQQEHLLVMHENQVGFDAARFVDARSLDGWAAWERVLQSHDSIVYYNSLIPPFVGADDLRDALGLLRVAPAVAAVAQAFIANNGIDGDVTGVHIRKTDFGDRVDDGALFRQVQAGTAGGARYFVCSDDAEVNRRFGALDGCAVFTKTAFPEKVEDDAAWLAWTEDAEGRRFPFNIRRGATSVVEALVDLLVLSRTRIVPTSGSTFLATARLFQACGFSGAAPAPAGVLPALPAAAPSFPSTAPQPTSPTPMDIPIFDRLRQCHLPAPRGVLQIGASYGQELALFAQNGLARGVFVEPLPAPFQHLASLCQKVPGWVAVNTLCSDVAGQTIDFHVASNGGMSSSMLEPDVHKALYPGITFGEKVQITSTTVDQLAAFLRANGHAAAIDACDLLFMDCQGAEFRILMGAPATLRQIKYIYMEVMRGSLYKDQVPFLTYCTWLEAMGFTLNDVYFGYPEQTGNALFVRKDLIGLA